MKMIKQHIIKDMESPRKQSKIEAVEHLTEIAKWHREQIKEYEKELAKPDLDDFSRECYEGLKKVSEKEERESLEIIESILSGKEES